MKKSVKLQILLCAALLTAVSCRMTANTDTQIQPETPASLPAPNAQAPIVLGDGVRASYADVVERVAPAVVNINILKREGGTTRGSQPFDSPFDDLFPNAQPPRQPQITRGTGSGVVVNSDGTILTNHHVVEGASDIEIVFNDKRTLKARIIGSDELSDLAVVKVEAKNLPYLNLGDSDKTRVGDVVLALGNPLGIGQTVTFGIISAKGRRTGLSAGGFEDFLQTDAPINRGNSGGALVNLTGELIGINSQILSSGAGGGSIGIGFAIPSNMARGVAEQLIKNGKVRRGQLGVNIQDITSANAAALKLKDTKGAIVSNVQPGSAAEKAGIERYDVIVALNGEKVEDGNSLRNRIAATQPGTEVTLTILRNNSEKTVKVTLGELSPEVARNGGKQPNNQTDEPSSQSGKLGVSLQPLTPELARRLQVRTQNGLVVTEVDADGAAAEAGIVQGDVIAEVNRQPVNNFDDFQAALEKAGNNAVLLLIYRRGQSIFLTIQP
jgi:serine protease Do